MKKIYFNNGNEITELDLFKATELLECEPNTPRETIKKDFYKLLSSNKVEFQNVFDKEKNEYALKGRGKDKMLFDLISAFDTSRFTDDDEQFVEDLQTSLLDGLVPPDTCKQAYDKLNESDSLDSLVLLNIIRSTIPREFIYYCPVTGAANTSGRKEVVLSEYLIGDNNE